MSWLTKVAVVAAVGVLAIVATATRRRRQQQASGDAAEAPAPPVPEYQHPAFPQPEDLNASVWRYMAFDRFQWLVEERRLYMSRLANFEDPFEGSTPYGDEATWDEALANAASDEQRQVIAANREKDRLFRAGWASQLYVNCWHLRDHESRPMWERYGKTPAGLPTSEAVVIRTSYRKLAECRPEHTEMGLVRYIDWATSRLPTLNMFHGAMHKRNGYEDEREVRIVALHMSLPSLEGVAEDGRGYLAHIDPVALVVEIRVHPDCTPEFFERVRLFCQSNGLPEPTRSSLAGVPRF